MKKTKVLFIFFLILCISMIPFSYVNAHSVELDPKSLISFSLMVINGEGKIIIKSSETGYSLYYQAVEISNTANKQIEEIENTGKTELSSIKTEMDKLNTECDNLNAKFDEAYNAYKNKIDSGETDAELETLKTAYETAKTNYQTKATEYNDKLKVYNAKVDEINGKIKELIPDYVENNWIKTEDGSFNIDSAKFSEERMFAVWAKLVCSDGSISYDVGRTKVSGTKVEEVAVESISLNKTSLNITEGSNYTLVATIKPSDATNSIVIWSSDNEKVAKVENGKVIAVSEGTATITATSKDGEHTANCKVTVTKKDSTAKQDNKKTDSTVASGKLPKAGSLTYVMIFAILLVSIVGIITYKKVKYLNFK